jgi:plasmid maintenance system antidote protein VapI
MATGKGKNINEAKVEIGSSKPKQWTEAEVGKLKAFARDNAEQRSDEQEMKNKLMALRFEIEEYLNDNGSKTLTLEYVVGSYLKILNLPFRKFAFSLDTTDSNLKKYISGKRRFNTDLALKFSHFFHTPAELWLALEWKNELSQLKDKKVVKQYEKYDYRKVLGMAG